MNLILLTLVSILIPNSVSGKCIWYDECGPDPETGKKLNCKYDGEPSKKSSIKN